MLQDMFHRCKRMNRGTQRKIHFSDEVKSRFGRSWYHCGLRAYCLTDSACFAIAGITWTALHPLPMTA